VSDHTFNDFILDPFLVTKPSQCQIYLGLKVIVKIEKIRINTPSAYPHPEWKLLGKKNTRFTYISQIVKIKNPMIDNQCIGFLDVNSERLEPPTF
jgi:hypothetical protein